MKHRLAAAGGACFLCAVSALVHAQGEFPLKYVDAEVRDPLVAIGGPRVYSSPKRPAALKALPKDVSDKVVYLTIPVGGKSVLAVVESASPPRLYVDGAGTGDLSASSPLPAAGSPGRGGEQMFGPVALPAGDAASGVPVKVRLRLEGVIRTGIVPRNAPAIPSVYGLTVFPAGYMAGEVRVAGQPYRVALVDSNVDGRYDKALDLSAARAPPSDTLAFDSDRDGKFAEKNAAGPGEILPLLAMLQVTGAYYSVTPAPDGSSVRLERAEPKCGTLDVGSGDVALTLMSSAGVFARLGGSQGKWQVPAGKCRVRSVVITRTDSTGAKWTLMSSRDPGKLADLDIRPGETLSVKVGPPLTSKIIAEDQEGRRVMISASLKGRAGEEYAVSIFLLKDGRDAPPRLKIFDEAGKELAAASFGFG
jgi:hypothetical protein